IRSYSPQRTIGGGTILDAFATKHRAREMTATHERLTALVSGNRPQQVAALVESSEKNGLNVADLMARTGWRDEVVNSAAEEAQRAGLVADVSSHFFSPAVLDQLKQIILKDVAAHHGAEPLSRGLSLEVLRGRHFAHLSADLFRGALADLEKQSLLVVEKDIVRRPEHMRAASGADAALRDQIEAI